MRKPYRIARSVELTGAGEAKFRQLRQAAIAFDQRLRRDLSEREVATVRKLLSKLRGNVEDTAK